MWNNGEQQRMQRVTVGLREPLWPGKLKGQGVKSGPSSLHSHKTHVACPIKLPRVCFSPYLNLVFIQKIKSHRLHQNFKEKPRILEARGREKRGVPARSGPHLFPQCRRSHDVREAPNEQCAAFLHTLGLMGFKLCKGERWP